MLTATERKRKTIINIIYYALLLTLFYCFMKYAFGLFFPFILAFVVAMIMQKPINFISRKTKLKKGLVSGVMILLLVIALGAFISLLGVKIWEGIEGFISFLTRKFDDLPAFLDKAEMWFADRIAFLPASVEKMVNTNADSFFDTAKKLLTSQSDEIAENLPKLSGISSLLGNVDFSAISNLTSGVFDTAKQIPSTLIAIVVSIFACIFMASDYDQLSEFAKRQLAGKGENLSKAKKIVTTSFKSLIKAYILIILVTFCEMFLGLSVLKLFGIYKGSWVFFIAIITAIVDIFPVLGTGTILLPWSLYSFISGDIPMGIGILVLYIFITVMRQFIEPKLVAGQLGLPPFLTIMGMYIGLKTIGFIGMFMVPLTIILIKLLNDEGVIHIWKNDEKEEITTNGGNSDENNEKI